VVKYVHGDARPSLLAQVKGAKVDIKQLLKKTVSPLGSNYTTATAMPTLSAAYATP